MLNVRIFAFRSTSRFFFRRGKSVFFPPQMNAVAPNRGYSLINNLIIETMGAKLIAVSVGVKLEIIKRML